MSFILVFGKWIVKSIISSRILYKIVFIIAKNFFHNQFTEKVNLKSPPKKSILIVYNFFYRSYSCSNFVLLLEYF
jgi:hypothetical protein